MTETAAAERPGLSPMFLEMMKKRGLKDWDLKVVSASEVTPRMRRISMTADGFEAFDPMPGQDMVFMLPDGEGGLGRRHYSVRRFDKDSKVLDVDVVLHGDSTPGTRWALGAEPGQEVLAFGPRGRNVLHPGADWRLFIGDETCLPPIFAMLETLQPGERAWAIIEVAADEDRQPLTTAGEVDLTWLSRGGAHAEPMSQRIIDAANAFQLPEGVGHIYLTGETSTIRRLRHDLIARGVAKDQLYGEGYWRPGRVGGHDHLVEH